MGQKYLRLSSFDIEGDYVGIVKKYLYLITDGKRILIKLSKTLRQNFDLYSLPKMTRIRLSGVIKLNIHNSRLKLHTENISAIAFPHSSGEIRSYPEINHTKQPPCPPNAKIMICQKSGCRKRGSEKLLSQLQQTLKAEGLHQQVKIQTTGCQKQCKQAPSCILKVGKNKYHQIRPGAIKQKLKKDISTQK
ncbi:hypothetical protein NIES3974_45390 [Calothrix sp. NIES-3974]|nr:hypothetical protein NIES3974_45390 [Calothrix sp. NIES-3974]